MGRGGDQPTGGSAAQRRSSFNPDGAHAKPVSRRRHPDYEPGLGVTVDRYLGEGSDFELVSAPSPFDLETMRVFEDHAVYTETGAWVGADRPVPHRRITNGILSELAGPEIVALFERYAEGDCGEGEIGFAVYESRGGQRLYLVDDATRSLEGEEPLRDPETSPGPQTLLLSNEY